MVLSRSLLQALIEKWQIKFHFYILLTSEDKAGGFVKYARLL